MLTLSEKSMMYNEERSSAFFNQLYEPVKPLTVEELIGRFESGAHKKIEVWVDLLCQPANDAIRRMTEKNPEERAGEREIREDLNAACVLTARIKEIINTLRREPVL